MSDRDRFMNALLIPVKDPANAKSRLAGLLSAGERRRLAWSMFEDVARAVSAATTPDRVVMVTSYQPAIARARAMGWEVLVEEEQVSESASVDWASRLLAERGCDALMRLPADLPLVQGEDIDSLLSVQIDSPGALIVPSREGSGTKLFTSRFGPNSLELHRKEAARVGIDCVIVNNPRIALDIDEPSDVEALLECGRGTQTFEVLVDLEVTERLKRISGRG
jgi:2-phospho-L-lactate guanylyltransferase